MDTNDVKLSLPLVYKLWVFPWAHRLYSLWAVQFIWGSRFVRSNDSFQWTGSFESKLFTRSPRAVMFSSKDPEWIGSTESLERTESNKQSARESDIVRIGVNFATWRRSTAASWRAWRAPAEALEPVSAATSTLCWSLWDSPVRPDLWIYWCQRLTEVKFRLTVAWWLSALPSPITVGADVTKENTRLKQCNKSIRRWRQSLFVAHVASFIVIIIMCTHMLKYKEKEPKFSELKCLLLV